MVKYLFKRVRQKPCSFFYFKGGIMNKKKLKSYLGKNVLVTFIDGRKRSGVLGFTSRKCNERRRHLPDMFTIKNISFKPCFVKGIISKEEISNG